MQIVFTKIANSSLRENLYFLERVWTAREVGNLLDDIELVISNLQAGKINQYQKSPLNTRSALIGKRHVRMYFRKSGDIITILLFYDVRQNPKNITAFLK